MAAIGAMWKSFDHMTVLAVSAVLALGSFDALLLIKKGVKKTFV
jgi:hypothetical protein